MFFIERNERKERREKSEEDSKSDELIRINVDGELKVWTKIGSIRLLKKRAEVIQTT